MNREPAERPRFRRLPARFLAFVAVCVVLFASGGALAHTGSALKHRVLRALERTAPVSVIAEVEQDGWLWAEAELQDEAFPLTIDVVAGTHGAPHRIVYLLAASGANFRSAFFTPAETNLAQFFRRNGYLVIGVTPREDGVAADQVEPYMAEWGLAKHREDVRKVVRAVEEKLPLPADMLGHSFSGGTALDYAAHYSGRLDRVLVLDLYSLDPQDAESSEAATRLYTGLTDLIGGGHTMDLSLADAKQLFIGANLYPSADSGVSRDFLGLPGNFTTAGFLHFLLVYSAVLPGEHTPVTGLPRDWPLVLSSCAGHYAPALDPQEDMFALDHVDPSVFLGAGLAMGSGAIPYALMKDWVAAAHDDPAYLIPWDGIGEDVVWVNMELGYGHLTHAADRIVAAGNPHVAVHVVPGYGNIDPLVSRTAAEDVWSLLLSE